MSKPFIKRLLLFAQVFCLSLLLFSCNTTKKIKYFQDIPDSGKVKNFPKAAYSPIIIRNGDMLNISIQTDDPSSGASTIGSGIQMPGTAGSTTSTLPGAIGSQLQAPVTGFPVDNNGNIIMPIIGTVAAAGSTTAQLTDAITTQALRYFKHPVVVVKLMSFKVDVTGEVAKPGYYTMPEEKESIMDVLAMAGDLTIFGKRENVLLIRENPDGTKTSYRVNLKKTDILSSPLYYMRPNDIIYVEPRSAKSDATDASQARYISIASAVLGLLIIIATRTK